MTSDPLFSGSEPGTDFRTTREVCALLGGVAESLVHDAVRRRFIAPPRIVGGIRLWSAADVEALRRVLAERADRRAARARRTRISPEGSRP